MQIQIQGEGHARPIRRRHIVRHSARNRLPIGRHLNRLPAINPRQQRIIRRLKPKLALPILADLADHIRRHCPIGILAHILQIRGNTIVFFRNSGRHIRVNVAHQHLIIRIGLQLRHNIFRLHLTLLGLILHPLRAARHGFRGLGCLLFRPSLLNNLGDLFRILRHDVRNLRLNHLVAGFFGTLNIILIRRQLLLRHIRQFAPQHIRRHGQRSGLHSVGQLLAGTVGDRASARRVGVDAGALFRSQAAEVGSPHELYPGHAANDHEAKQEYTGAEDAQPAEHDSALSAAGLGGGSAGRSGGGFVGYPVESVLWVRGIVVELRVTASFSTHARRA